MKSNFNLNNLIKDTFDSIEQKYFDALELEKCNFEDILINDAPQGTALTFISIADAVVDFPVSWLFAILFYGLITLLGIGSMIGTFEGVLTPIWDALKGTKFENKIPKSILVLILAVIHLVIGFLFTTDAGTYWVDLFNNYSASIVLIVMGLGKCKIIRFWLIGPSNVKSMLPLGQYIITHWVFGSRKWLNEIDWMIGRAKSIPRKILNVYLMATWTVISPLMITAILIFYIYDTIAVSRPAYQKWDSSIGDWARDSNGTSIYYEYETAGKAIIWILHLVVLLPFPAFFIKSFYKGIFQLIDLNFYSMNKSLDQEFTE